MANNPNLSQGTALAACAAMAVLYVVMLYVPQSLLRLPPARTLNEHYIQRFLSSAVASGLASYLCFLLLPVEGQLSCVKPSAIFGLRTDHLWQATLYPLLLTALLYLGPLVMAVLDLVPDTESDAIERGGMQGGGFFRAFFANLRGGIESLVLDIFSWRNFVVGPITEEWVFRACMIPLLLCANFSPLKVIFFCPLFFGLDGVGLAAHLNLYWEMVYPEKQDHQKASLIVGFRFAYTTVFGWYATYLYLRTGHLVAPIVAHVFCNVMGFPAIGVVFGSSHSKVLRFSFLAGLGGFTCLLQPATTPSLYNNVIPGNSWLGHCMWGD